MNATFRPTEPADQVAEAARLVGKMGGRPKGSFSSRLAAWLRCEIKEYRQCGYGCTEAFWIVREAQIPAGPKSLVVTARTMDKWEIEAKEDEHGNDKPVTVSLSYWKNLWGEFSN